MESLLLLLLVLIGAPLPVGLILKIKAFFAGKKGPPLLIKYFTLGKLLRKGSVYSTSTSFVFRMGPLVGCAVTVMALLFTPIAWTRPMFSFPGDIIALLYCLGIGRFFTIAAALDTASPFQGMGAAREAFFGCLSEVTMFTVLILFHHLNGSLSLAAYFTGPAPIALGGGEGWILVPVIIALFMVLLTENSRVPVDDPATHLELTMIHEVMILDHSGPDLALIELGSFWKLFFHTAIIAQLLTPPPAGGLLIRCGTFLLLLLLVYLAVGITESITARYRLNQVPKFILTSTALVAFAAILTMGLIK